MQLRQRCLSFCHSVLELKWLFYDNFSCFVHWSNYYFRCFINSCRYHISMAAMLKIKKKNNRKKLFCIQSYSLVDGDYWEGQVGARVDRNAKKSFRLTGNMLDRDFDFNSTMRAEIFLSKAFTRRSRKISWYEWGIINQWCPMTLKWSFCHIHVRRIFCWSDIRFDEEHFIITWRYLWCRQSFLIVNVGFHTLKQFAFSRATWKNF